MGHSSQIGCPTLPLDCVLPYITFIPNPNLTIKIASWGVIIHWMTYLVYCPCCFLAVPPSHPINVSIQSMDIGPTFARVHWQAPLFRGIPRVSHYEIKVTQVNGSADPFTFSTADSTRDFNVTGLSPGTRYEICVAAICERIVGHSPPSDPVFANTTTTGMCVKCAKFFMHLLLIYTECIEVF